MEYAKTESIISTNRLYSISISPRQSEIKIEETARRQQERKKHRFVVLTVAIAVVAVVVVGRRCHSFYLSAIKCLLYLDIASNCSLPNRFRLCDCVLCVCQIT